jgi:aspartyl-tRNA synthetase
MSAEELNTAITAKGEEIRLVKAEKSPTMKDDLSPLIAELLALKVSYKNVTGEDFGGKPEVIKEKKVVVETKKEGPSKSELSKIKKKEAIAAAKARDAALAAEKNEATPVVEIVKEKDESSNEVDNCAHLHGDSPVITSSVMTDRVFKQINDLTEDRVGQTIWIRGRVGNSRAVGKGIFLLLRQQMSIVQAVMFQSEKISKAMIKYGAGISLESIVDIRALITKADSPIQSASVKNIELAIEEIHVISRAQELPFLVDDAGRSEADSLANNLPSVNADTSLNFRWVDLRTPANQAIFRIQAGVCGLFREYFSSKNFIEIHTPKLIGGASEGGSNVFNFQYFGQPACLAQSPQLYKQMTAGCGGFDRVFEIGPVFRAENSNTHRHLCEFTGMDFEMAIYEHYYEALDVRII